MELYDYQLEAVRNMKNGCILCANVGRGKSITALAYYWVKQHGSYRYLDGTDDSCRMNCPKDLYIITTARKRDTLEWDFELMRFCLASDPEINLYKNKVVVDSWNNIKNTLM